ncbi:MAG: monofunctional biosynthetic peptidoglycan transglycosylase [Gammaproteobacteria bacterium]|nr:monofunctional biosynthetic peptidoglycan transglycosylase [Gammaproteobacteria bacterium]
MLALKKGLQALLKKLTWLAIALCMISALLVGSLNFINPPIWSWKIQRMIYLPESSLTAGQPTQIHHQWVSWANISNQMKLAVIAAEDQLFLKHSGFDVDSILDALQASANGKRLRGASTISQQTAKNLFLWSGQSFLRKGIEAWLTILMEVMLSKQRILEVYLNIVEFGPGIFGVEAASQFYFKKPANKISAHQAARLASVLPNPYRFHVNKPSKHTVMRTQWIKKQMRQLGMGVLPEG